VTAKGKKWAWRCSLTCVLVFAVNNFAFAPLVSGVSPFPPETILMLVCVGGIGAQAALHAIWCVLAPVGLVKRLTAGVVAATVLYGSWVLGFVWSSGRGSLEDDLWPAVAMGALLCLPLTAVAIQAPLWAVKGWFRWRVILPSERAEQADDRAFGIREVLVATGVVAAALSAARLAAPFTASPAEFLPFFAITALAFAFISLFTTIPLVLATLRARPIRLALPALLLFDAAFTVGAIAVFSAVARGGPSLRWRHYVEIAAMVGTFFAWVTGVMLVVRGFGLRLSWGRSAGA
jgi:hypothetical protein